MKIELDYKKKDYVNNKTQKLELSNGNYILISANPAGHLNMITYRSDGKKVIDNKYVKIHE